VHREGGDLHTSANREPGDSEALARKWRDIGGKVREEKVAGNSNLAELQFYVVLTVKILNRERF
jgi:hypothetical protein